MFKSFTPSFDRFLPFSTESEREMPRPAPAIESLDADEAAAANAFDRISVLITASKYFHPILL